MIREGRSRRKTGPASSSAAATEDQTLPLDSVAVPTISGSMYDFDGPFDWLDPSLPASFGLGGSIGQGRDIWEMFDLDDFASET